MKLFSALIAVPVFALAFPANADPRQDPTADYVAEAVAKTEGQPDANSKIWYTKDKVRVDVSHEGQSMSVIMDRTKKQMTVMVPKSKMYQQDSMPEGETQNPIKSGTWEVAKAGDESVSGMPATKWQISGKSNDGRAFTGFIWTTKENIQVKMEGETEDEGKKVKVASELRNIKIGPVDESVFVVPSDYKAVPKDDNKDEKKD